MIYNVMITMYQDFKTNEGRQTRIETVEPNERDAMAYVGKLRQWVESGFGIPSLRGVVGVKQVATQRSADGRLLFRLYDIYRPEDEPFVRARLSGRSKRQLPVQQAVKGMLDATLSFPSWFRTDWAAESLTNDLLVVTDLAYDDTTYAL